MGDFGMRISIDGKDVGSCSDLDCVVTTKYALLKGAIYGGGSTVVSIGETNTITIPHNLGYIPFMQSYVDIVYDEGYYAEMPVYGRLTATEEYNCNGYADAENIYLRFFYDSAAPVGSKEFNYKYFVFVDKGKL